MFLKQSGAAVTAQVEDKSSAKGYKKAKDDDTIGDNLAIAAGSSYDSEQKKASKVKVSIRNIKILTLFRLEIFTQARTIYMKASSF